MTYLTRFIEEKLDLIIETHKDKAQKNVLIIEGARQTGKSTLIEHLLAKKENVIKINLEHDKILRSKIQTTEQFSEFEELLSAELGFALDKQQILFIDEAQESTQLGAYVRFMKESWKNTTTILTGSSMKRLYAKEQRIPVGRTSRLLVTPLTFQEFLLANKKNFLFEKTLNFSKQEETSNTLHQSFLEQLDIYLKVGGLPEVVSSYLNKENYLSVRKNILLEQEEDFIRKEEDIPQDLFMSALSAVANNLACPSKYSHVPASHYYAQKIFNLLRKWKLIYQVEQKGTQPTSNFTPKRYLYDSGIAHDLRNMPFPDISLLHTLNKALRTPLGGLLENMIIIQIMSESMGLADISGWKSGQNKEVDFIFREEKVIPMECKASLKVSNRSFKNLLEYLEVSGLTTGILLSLAPFSILKQRGKVLVNLPVYFFTIRNIREIMRV